MALHVGPWWGVALWLTLADLQLKHASEVSCPPTPNGPYLLKHFIFTVVMGDVIRYGLCPAEIPKYNRKFCIRIYFNELIYNCISIKNILIFSNT